jgi:hypothetical protein
MPHSEKQRRWACAQTGKSRKNFKGKPALSKKEAEEMCTDPLKEEDILKEVEKYFDKNKDQDYLRFDQDELSSIENIMDPDKPAPWDHFTDTEDDEDVDVQVAERENK